MLLKIFNYIKNIILGTYYRLVEFFKRDVKSVKPQTLDPVDVAPVDDGQRVPEAIQEETLHMHEAVQENELDMPAGPGGNLSDALRVLSPMVTVMKNQNGQPRLLLGNQAAYECCADNKIEALVAEFNINSPYQAGKEKY